MTDPHPTRVPLSVLDLAIVPDGGTGAEAIQHAIDLAIDLDAHGYRRVWFAEHHLSPGVGSATPGVLAAAVAARTQRISVGSGAVLLSTTSPLIAAEQFGTIAALHPGRVNLGLGRAFTPPKPAADGSTPPARPKTPGSDVAHDVDGLHVPAAPPIDFGDSELRQRILAQNEVIGASRSGTDFAAELELVLALQQGRFVSDAGQSFVSAPIQGAAFDLWVLASSPGESARVAGSLGLPLAANYHVAPHTTVATVQAYREAFVPGVLPEPYVLVSADVLTAPTQEEAQHLALGFAEWVISIRRGTDGAIAYPRPEDGRTRDHLTEAEEAVVRDRLDTRFVGTPATVVEKLEALQRVTGADELLLTTQTHDHEATRDSFALIAQAWRGDDAGAPVAGSGESGSDSGALADAGIGAPSHE